MKKLLLLGFMVISLISYGEENTPNLNRKAKALYGEFGISMPMQEESLFSGLNSKNDKDFSIFIDGYEISAGIYDQGFGFAVEDFKTKINGVGAKIRLLPMYYTYKLNYPVSSFVIYGKAQIGWFFDQNIMGETKIPGGKIDGGLYYAFGGGVRYNNFAVDLLYRVYESDATVNHVSRDFEYKNINLGLTYFYGK